MCIAASRKALAIASQRLWETRMMAAGYTNQKEIPMTQYTRSQECEFVYTHVHSSLYGAVQYAESKMADQAAEERYPYMVHQTYKITVTMTNEGVAGGEHRYSATASATFARVVPISPFTEEPNEGDLDKEF